MILHLSLRNWFQSSVSWFRRKRIFKHPFSKILLLTAILIVFLEFFILNQKTAKISPPPPNPAKSPESLFFPALTSNPSSFQVSAESPVGRPLTQEEKERIREILPNAPVNNKFPLFEQLPLFILHDTAGLLAKDTIYHQQKKNNGPFGDGIAAYVARDGEPIVTRAHFFEIRRPTALAYEKALDILPEKERNQQVRHVYQSISELARNEVFAKVAEGLNINKEPLIKGANIWLNSRSESEFNQMRRNYANQLDGAKSMGLWGMTQVCHDVLKGKDLAKSPDKKANLTQVCQKVYPALKVGRQRVFTSVNVELVQYTGSHCFITDAQVKQYNNYAPDYAKVSKDQVVSLKKDGEPLYTEAQYDGLTLAYLYAALQAGVFPEITTHFLLDEGIGNHCDPRGFDLDYFYDKISTQLGHSWGTRYGIIPQYGTDVTRGDNIWWSDLILGQKF